MIVEPGSLLRQPCQEWIHGSEKKIRAESSGHSGKGRRQTGDGMAADLREQNGTKRNQDYISRVDSQTRIDTGKNQSGCDQPMRHAPDKSLERSREKTAAFSHPHSDHGNQEPSLKVQSR